MGQKKKGSASKAAPSGRSNESLDQRCAKFARLRAKFAAVGKLEWWWIMDETMDEVARQLKEHSYVVLDDFFLAEMADEIRAAVSTAYEKGRLSEVSIVNGKTGDIAVNQNLRGDFVKWADANDEGFGCLRRYTVLMGTLVSELSDRLPELKCINSHSKCMATCYPPGARYTAHVDHDGKSESTKSRRLTCITYLNPSWKSSHGGELAVYGPASLEDQSSMHRPPVATIPPLHNRLVIFFPDWRVPHEVRAATVPRFALTTWFNENETMAPESRKHVALSEIEATPAREPRPVASAEPVSSSASAAPGAAAAAAAGAAAPAALRPAAAEESAAAESAAAAPAQWSLAPAGDEVSLRLELPWATSIADLELDIAAHALRVTPSASAAASAAASSAGASVPPELAARVDVDGASAAFSRRKQCLTVRLPLRA
eukprot:TRINITY_DN12441_c0_g1_i2.p1 TRINITY_DN12441_c0_g1~~TRINITY_DN12441_c0_g1_i2.p1  ORF type:complete len:437 (-),score=102.97 TRINITY_DN12441_c0_g1_i2:87-1376(-)